MAKHLITSAIPYINGIKHLGNLVGSMLPADVYARFLRQNGHEVLYICGTDEHGTPAELAALEAGVPVSEFCATMYQTQKTIYEGFNLSFDFFGRSSCPENHTLTQHMFQKLYDNGYIQIREIEQIYSIDDARFLPDRYVVGTCPHCKYDKARGDQCDGCGQLLDPMNLIQPRSSLSPNSPLEVRKEKHLFLDLPKLTSQLEEWINQHPEWNAVTRGVARKWLQEGLQERCISRDLSWGVKVPLKDFEGKVFYVWFDAPNAYIAITQAYATSIGQPDLWKAWWLDPNVSYTQFMAKDNVAFHTIFWPAMLIGTQEPWHLVDDIKGFNWLTYQGGKFSTSQNRGIFTNTALELFPAEYWRYYLMANAPESTDADFSLSEFAHTINKDLADTLGNFVGRVSALVNKYCESSCPELIQDFPESLQQQVSHLVEQMTQALEAKKFRQYMQHLRALWALSNEYITHAEPWKVMKQNPEAAKAVLGHCLVLIRTSAITACPVIPDIAQKLFTILGETQSPSLIPFSKALSFEFMKEQKITPTPPLFQKIDEEAVKNLSTQFAG